MERDDADLETGIERVALRLARARRMLAVTGAGVSAESGMPTYRGLGGLYQDRETEAGMPIEEVLSGPTLARDPILCWRYLAEIGRAVSGCRPNDAHRALAGFEDLLEVVVLTQNVDGFHRQAGSTRVIDLHGDCHRLLCLACPGRREVADYRDLAEVPPRCPACGGVERPDVVLFEEPLPLEKTWELRSELRQGFDVYLSIGTSSLFSYITRPFHDARQEGRFTVEVNPGPTSLSEVVDVRLVGKAGSVLPRLLERVRDLRNPPGENPSAGD